MRVVIAGDYCDNNRVKPVIEQGLFNELFGGIAQIIRSADYSIVNFEMPIENKECKPEAKCGCVLKGSRKSVEALKYAGFNLCTLANNHIMDLGPEACLSTRDYLQSSGLDTIGIGKNIEEASSIKYVTINDEVLSIINCCEHEFSISDYDKVGACPLDPIQQYYKIQEAKSKSDYLLVIVHGGHEHFQLPSERMQKTYRFFIDAGADAVVNHHQHCFCGYERYQGKPIFYGLGNFCFDAPETEFQYWNDGMLADITFSKEYTPHFSVIPFTQCKNGISIKPISDRKEFDFIIGELNRIIQNPKLLRKCLEDYYSTRSEYLLSLLEPYFGRIVNKLYRMKLLPPTMTKDHFLCIDNMIECESHNDVLLYALKKRYDKLNSESQRRRR